MKVASIEWDANNLRKLQGRSTWEEVEEVLKGRCYPARSKQRNAVRGEHRVNIIGSTCAGRILLVVVAPQADGTTRMVTVYEASDKEAERYLEWRKTVRR